MPRERRPVPRPQPLADCRICWRERRWAERSPGEGGHVRLSVFGGGGTGLFWGVWWVMDNYLGKNNKAINNKSSLRNNYSPYKRKRDYG